MNSTNQSSELGQSNNSSEKEENGSESMLAAAPEHSATTPDIPKFGWSFYAERINGRFAMIGFIAVLIIEALSNQTFLHWAGFIN